MATAAPHHLRVRVRVRVVSGVVKVWESTSGGIEEVRVALTLT